VIMFWSFMGSVETPAMQDDAGRCRNLIVDRCSLEDIGLENVALLNALVGVQRLAAR
jgi:hypothetical protein